MANVLVIAGQAGKNGQGSAAPVMRLPARARQAIDTTSSNAVSTVRLNAGEVAVISVTGGTVRVATAVAADPNATTGPEIYLAAGAVFPFEAVADDTRIAVADV